MTESFPDIRFKGELRPSQKDVLEIARKQLAAGERRLHIVAPPGSGKTVLGLYIWADCVRRPTLVLSPNSAIQAQWAARIDLFQIDRAADAVVGTDPKSPTLLTSLTYQAVTLPKSGGEDLDAQAVALWQDTLIEKGQAKDPDEARIWIEDLRRHNTDYFAERLSAYRKQLRDMTAIAGEGLKTLHTSSLATLDRLREHGVGLIILDECHHLMGHWGRVLADAHGLLDRPIVLGLTATPPDRQGKTPEDISRYEEFFGPIDYEVPVPAVVKDGFLAPYQDLVQFVRPTADELAFIANADEQLHALVAELCQSKPARAALDAAAPPHENASTQTPAESLPQWLLRVLAERELPTGPVKDWSSFERRDPVFACAAREFLLARGIALPDGVPELDHARLAGDAPETRAAAMLSMPVLVPVLDRYIRHRLIRSADAADHELAERAIQRLRLLGVQITETGSQACASPVGRVMAYARGKTQALLPILKAERQALGERIRSVVVTDFEKTSAVTTEISHLLDAEAGGAIAAYRTLLSDADTDALDPVLVTGSTVLVDDDLAAKLLAAAIEWLAGKGLDVQLSYGDEDGFKILRGSGGDWCPRVYVAMITELFQRGLTRCLVGTRGLLGEGWDASKVNVLVDLTTVTTSMSVNQLRGRSLRLDADDPTKLADNWDVVCVAPEFVKGLDDYRRFIDKHQTIFGLTEDGAIEKGVGHVHAAFTELKPEGIEGSMAALNAEMLEHAGRRAEVRTRWRIGEPYRAEPIRAIEARTLGPRDVDGFPPFAGASAPWSARSLTLAIGQAVLGSLREARLIQGRWTVHVADRSGGYVRAFLENADEADSAQFTQSLQEALGPIDRPRYVIPRYLDHIEETWLSRLLPAVVGRYFQRQSRRMAMLHAVPSVLAKNKDLVALFQRHWNAHVSPGEALYAHHGEGEQLIAQARKVGCVPRAEVRAKEIFV